MPKMKTKKAAAKRFSVTGTGKLTHPRANKQKLNGHKSRKRIRRLRQTATTDKTNVKSVKKMLPYL